MKRLTKKKLGSSYPLKNDASAKVGLFTDYDGFYAFFEAVNRLGEIEDILGDDYDLARLREMVQADRDGRCVVLPFKVGDTAWFTVYGGRPVSSEVSSVAITFRVDGAHYYFETENEDGATDYFHGEAIGKTVFLTREAAEEALKGQS